MPADLADLAWPEVGAPGCGGYGARGSARGDRAARPAPAAVDRHRHRRRACASGLRRLATMCWSPRRWRTARAASTPASPARCRSGRPRWSCSSSSSCGPRPRRSTRVVLVSAHGGNAEPVSRAVEQLADASRATCCCSRRSGTATRTRAGRRRRMMLALAPGRQSRWIGRSPGDLRPMSTAATCCAPGAFERSARPACSATRPARRRRGPTAARRDRRQPDRRRRVGERRRAVTSNRSVALVTGAARGIGAATALALAAEGWSVLAVDIAADDPGMPYPLATQADLDARRRRRKSRAGRAAIGSRRSSPTCATGRARGRRRRGGVAMGRPRRGDRLRGVIAGGVPVGSCRPSRSRPSSTSTSAAC